MFGKVGDRGKSERDVSSVADTNAQIPQCPICKSKKVWRDGLRSSLFGEPIQRWLCRKCGYRFSDPSDVERAKKASQIVQSIDTKNLKTPGNILGSSQICVEETKNLDPELNITQVPERRIETNSKLLEFAWKLKQQGYNEETIRGYISCLRQLILRGANLDDPETVKTALSKEQKWSQNRKRNAINAYTQMLKFEGRTWIKPKCRVDVKFPYIPSEQEIDALIAGSGKRGAAFLQLLKETAMRCGEAKRLRWTDIDIERRIITCNAPEKGSNSRMWKVSATLIGMLTALPRTSDEVFPSSLKALKTTFRKTRIRLAAQLQNPRLLDIHFHTLRHWKATMLYHQTKDQRYVQKFLGHKSSASTEIYINIENTIFAASPNDEFTVKIAETPQELKALLEAGYEYVCQKDTLIFLRKRK